MALCMRDKQDMANYSPVEDLERRWKQNTKGKRDTTVNLERISDSTMVKIWFLQLRFTART